MKKYLYILLGILIAIPTIALGINISVPSAPSAGYMLISTSTGTYIATTTSPLLVGSVLASSTTATSRFLGGLNVSGTTQLTGSVGIGSTINNTAGTLSVDGNFIGAINLLNGTMIALPSLGATNPPYSFIGDNNTGLGQFGLGADTVSLATAGATRLTVGETGNVGIGITFPLAVLNLKAGTTAANSSPLKFTSGSLMTNAEAGAIEYLSNQFYIRGSDGLSVAGNLGIGTTSPAYKLSIEGSSTLGNQALAGYFSATSTTATSTISNALALTSNSTNGSSVENTTDGTINVGCTTNNALCGQFYSNNGATQDSPLVLMRADNTAFDDGLLWLLQDGTGGGAYNIKMQGPAPQIEWVEADQTTPAGKFEDGVNGDIRYIAGRNAGDTSFEIAFEFDRLANGGSFRQLGTSASYFMGNLGIGTTTPYAKLSVVGEAVARNFTATSTTATSTISGPLKLGSTGTSATTGNATLVGGTVTVTTGAALSTGFVHLTRKTSGGTIGTAITYTITNGSFTITSDSVLDTSTFTWMVTN